MKIQIFITFVLLIAFFTLLIAYLYHSQDNCFISSHICSTESASVTKIIHQSWKDKNIPNLFRNFYKTWINNCYKTWIYMFWSDQDNLNLIKYYYPWFLPIYNNLPSAIYRVDVSRYFYLFHYGGIYTDLDNECLKPFEHLLKNYSLVFGAMKGQIMGTSLKEGYVQNSFMYSKPRHEFWLELINEIGFIAKTKTKFSPEALTGPIILSNMLKRFISRNDIVKGSVKIYSPEYFNPISWIDRSDSKKYCKEFWKMNEQDFRNCRQSMIERGSYVVQYHAHSWSA